MKIQPSHTFSRWILVAFASGLSALAMDSGLGGGGVPSSSSFSSSSSSSSSAGPVEVDDEGMAVAQAQDPRDHPGWAEWAAQHGEASADRVYGEDEDEALAEVMAIMETINPTGGGGIGGGGMGGGARPVRTEAEETELAIRQANLMAQREASGRPPLARSLNF